MVFETDGRSGDGLPGGKSGEDPGGRTRQQKHDRRDAALLLKLQVENRFPSIWMPSTELRDLRALLKHRHQWVRMRTRVQNAASHRAQSRAAAGQVPLEPNRPTRDHVVAAGAAYRPSTNRVAGLVPPVGRTDQQARGADHGPGLAASWSKAVNDTSGSRAYHGVGDGGVFG